MKRKSDLRKKILKIRSELSLDEQNKKSAAIREKLFQTEQFKNAENLLVYADYKGEVFTKEIIEMGFKLNKKIGAPKVLFDGEMEFFEISDYRDLVSGYKGILEPKEGIVFSPKSALVIVPGVAFDNSGKRIGYGKGFYDRYLNRHKEYDTIALAYNCQIVEDVPSDTHDIKIDLIITE